MAEIPKLKKDDLHILWAIWEEEQLSTTELAHLLYEPESRAELSRKDSYIRNRLNKMKKQGLLEKQGSKYAITDKVFIGQTNIEMTVKGDTEEMQFNNVVFVNSNGTKVFYSLPK